MEMFAVMIYFIFFFKDFVMDQNCHMRLMRYQHEDIINIPNPHQRRGGEINSTMLKMHLLKKCQKQYIM
jgi:hypothetical protein